MKKDWVLLTIAVVVTLLLCAGFGGFYWYTHRTKQTSAVAPASTESSSGSSTLNVGSSSQIELGGGQTINGSNTGGTSSDSSNKSTASTGTPTAAELASYDKYKDNKQSLYGDITVGNGAAVASGKKLTITYTGWLTNGTVFDRTSMAKPFNFIYGNNEVVTGLEQGINGMKVGGKRRIIIPPAAGYGATGKDPVPPNSVMVFDIELLSQE